LELNHELYDPVPSPKHRTAVLEARTIGILKAEDPEDCLLPLSRIDIVDQAGFTNLLLEVEEHGPLLFVELIEVFLQIRP
jgi:hypothetical protein